MSTTDPNEALVRFVELLRGMVGCITTVPLAARPIGPDIHHIAFATGGPVVLRTARGYPDLKLAVVHHCRVSVLPAGGPLYSVSSIYYAYDIS